jgi:hypothetical protein
MGLEKTQDHYYCIYWPIVPALDDGDDCGAISGINEWQRNRSTVRRTDPVTLCTPQIPWPKEIYICMQLALEQWSVRTKQS